MANVLSKADILTLQNLHKNENTDELCVVLAKHGKRKIPFTALGRALSTPESKVSDYVAKSYVKSGLQIIEDRKAAKSEQVQKVDTVAT